MAMLWESIGWISTVLLVGGYALVATRRLDARSPTYHVLNLVGAIGLAAYSLYKVAWRPGRVTAASRALRRLMSSAS